MTKRADTEALIASLAREHVHGLDTMPIWMGCDFGTEPTSTVWMGVTSSTVEPPDRLFLCRDCGTLHPRPRLCCGGIARDEVMP